MYVQEFEQGRIRARVNDYQAEIYVDEELVFITKDEIDLEDIKYIADKALLYMDMVNDGYQFEERDSLSKLREFDDAE
jgi:hypothetical protein